MTISLAPSSKITQNQMFHVLGKEFDMDISVFLNISGFIVNAKGGNRTCCSVTI